MRVSTASISTTASAVGAVPFLSTSRRSSLARCFVLLARQPRFRPFEFHAQDALAFPFRGEFHLLALSFQFQKTGIVGIVAVHFSVADFEDAVRHFIQEITVMGDHKDGSAVIFQVILEPGEHRIVEMVCRLVEDQDVKIGRKHFCQATLRRWPPERVSIFASYSVIPSCTRLLCTCQSSSSPERA